MMKIYTRWFLFIATQLWVSVEGSKYLQKIKIIVSEINKSLGQDGQLCYYVNNNTLLETGSVLTFDCYTQPTWGRYLYVVRAVNAIIRPDAIAIGEINILTSNIGHPVNKLELSNYHVVQKGTYGGHHADLAIDKNTVTYSVACGNCNGAVGDGPGLQFLIFGGSKFQTLCDKKLDVLTVSESRHYFSDDVCMIRSTPKGYTCFDKAREVVDLQILILFSSSKSCGLEPIPTGLMKEFVETLLPFL
uniref:Uncharacterized protein n=1 Tax=Helobdella robusta TaxID=6412 RepID=T1FL09_HELRO